MINSSHSIHRFSCLFAFALIGGVIITTFTSAQQAVPSPGQLPSVEESRYLKLPPAALPDLQAGEPMLFVAPACAQAEILLPPAQVDTAKHQFAHKLVILEGDVQTMNRFLDHFADPEDAIPAKRFFDDDRKGAFYLPLKNFDTPEGQAVLESLNLKPIASPAIIVTDPSMPAQFVMGGEIPYPIVKKNEQGLRVQTMEMRSLGFALKLFCRIKDDGQLVQLVDVADRQLDGNVEVIMETADGFVRVGQPQIVGRQLQCVISGSFDVPLAFCCSGKTAGEIHAAKAQDVKRVIVIQTRRIENQNTSPEETESDTEAKPGDAEEQFSFFLGNGR